MAKKSRPVITELGWGMGKKWDRWAFWGFWDTNCYICIGWAMGSYIIGEKLLYYCTAQGNVYDQVTFLYKRTWQNIVNQWYFNDNNNNNNENKRKTHLAEVGWGVVCSERQGPKEPLSEVSSKGFLE